MPRPRNPDAEAAPGEDAVQAARTRARRRLVGALVLLVAGVLGFPLLFETQPRPVAMDTPIVTAPAPQVAAPRAAVVPPRPLPQAETAPPAEGPASAAGQAAPPAPAASKPPHPERKAEAKPAPKPEVKPEVKAESAPEVKPEVKPETTPEAAGRFVVQAGAYSDPASLRDARQKIERLGMKTYTQVIEGDAGKRTRVRVGPFATKDEAARAAAKIKAAGLPTAVLAL
jgi:DedD protein